MRKEKFQLGKRVLPLNLSTQHNKPIGGRNMKRSETSHRKTIFALAVLSMMAWPVGSTFAADDEMVKIPRGEFTMGSQEHKDETAHNVVLDEYYIDKYEVSNRQYAAFMKKTGHPAPAYWDDPRLNKPTQPVVGVNWHDANAFCKANGKRLPTEAEWERAAKGPKGDHYPWGHKLSPQKANYGQHVGKTAAFDSYPEGKSGFGVYNMAGNVFEWVSDWYQQDYYKHSPSMNPQGPQQGYNFANQGPVKVLRGGSWLAPETSLHTSHRFWNQPENNSYGVGLGFRCAKTAESATTKMVNDARDHYMHALISMGEEKWSDAMASMGQALKGDPENKEYLQLKEMIQKNM